MNQQGPKWREVTPSNEMSVRLQLAAMAMQGILTGSRPLMIDFPQASIWALQAADALLEEYNKPL